MTKLLAEAFKKASSLSDIDQNRFAEWVLKELEAERKWDSSFADSEDFLASLASEALEEHGAGETKDLDWEEL